MKTALLIGWHICDREPQSVAVADLRLPDGAARGWLPCPVPGDVNAVLVAAGRMPDPHYDTQARRCYWVTSRDWWYRLTFDAPEGCCGKQSGADFCLDRVDGTAHVFLNGAHVGSMENAFRLHRLDVAGKLRPTGNELLVCFRSIDQLLGGPRLHELGGWKNRRAWLRKPQFNFGWDWALPLPSIGLAGPVWLEHDHERRFHDVSLRTFVSGRVDFFFDVSPAAKREHARIRLRVTGHGADIERVIDRDAFRSYTTLAIPNPALWWPHGYGSQPLYAYEVELLAGGEVVDLRRGRFGIREVEVMEEPFTADAGPGFSFGLKVNGAAIFCKGGNWIPLELWPGTVKDEAYDFYLRKTVEANFNIQRVWGGGIYEAERFYDQCDELGILVWQDFMFASAGYPVDRLRREIIAEAECQIKRLRNHPCIALWCGCNEDVFSWEHPFVQEAAANAGKDTGVYSVEDAAWRVDRLQADPELYTMILRGLVSRHGHGVPYTESSPQSRDDAGNAPNSGNAHLSCWKYALFQTGSRYERWRGHFEQVCSFNSEFCIQGPCSAALLRRFLAPENHWPPNDAWIYHIQRGHGFLPHHEQHLRIAQATFGPVADLGAYVKHGQVLHAEMMRAEFESARRDRPNNGGTMMWMFNDCWPTSNWSIIDYTREPKPAYYAARRACRSVCPIVFERQGMLEFMIGNDTLEPMRTNVVFGRRKLDGAVVSQDQATVDVAANGTTVFRRRPRAEMSCAPDEYVFLRGEGGGQVWAEVAYFPNGWREVPWPRDPGITLRAARSQPEGGLWKTTLTVQTSAYARCCHLRAPEALGAEFADNYFDLPAGAQTDINVVSRTPLEARQISIGHWWTNWDWGSEPTATVGEKDRISP